MKADLRGSGDVGEIGPSVQEQYQAGALEEVGLGGAAAREQAGLDEEGAWEVGLVNWGWSRQGEASS